MDRLARRLAETGWRPVVVVGPGEEEVARRVAASSGVRLPVVGDDTDGLRVVLLAREREQLIGIIKALFQARQHFDGEVPINSQTGPLREHYGTVQSLLASREVIGDERERLEARRDVTIRLLFFDREG